MNTVKGSKQYELEVVPYRPVFRWSMRLLGLGLVVAIVAGSYFTGHFEGTSAQQQAITELSRLRQEIVAVRKSADEHRQQVANLKLGSEVDRQASEGVRTEVIELKAQIAALEEDITFYKGLMSPTANRRGLTIGSVNIVETDRPKQYRYKLVLQQLATNHQLLNGYLTVKVAGRQNGQPVTLSLKDLNDKINYDRIKLRFKYFQNFTGEMALPEGFEPIHIELVAKSTGKNAVTIEEKFGWLIHNPKPQNSVAVTPAPAPVVVPE